ENWNADRTIRAGFLAELLTGGISDPGRLRYIKLRGACIVDPLDLGARKLLCPVELEGCCFERPISLREAEASSIGLPGCHVPALMADRLRTVGSVLLSHGFTARGEVSLRHASIGGQLALDGASLTNEGG